MMLRGIIDMTDTYRIVYPKHVSTLIPRKGIFIQISSRIKDVWTCANSMKRIQQKEVCTIVHEGAKQA
jgi:hypothetical protein